MKLLAILALASVSLNAAEPLLKDDFSDPTLKTRRAARGEWKYADGIATCTQDDELYKKSKDHGPIIFYTLGYTDAAIRLSYKAEGSKSVVFTFNSITGHVFRFVSSDRGTSIRAFAAGSGEHKSVELAKGPALKLGEWTDISVDLRGTKATVKIGKDFSQTVEHPDLAAAKSNFSIGFAFGTMSVRGVEVTK